MHISGINKTNNSYNKSFGMSNAIKNSATKNKIAKVVSEIAPSRPKSKINITIAMDQLYAYARILGRKDKALSLKSNDITEAELELINPSDLYQKINTAKNKEALIEDIFKVKWSNDNVQILKDIDKIMKQTGCGTIWDKNYNQITKYWYGTPEEIFEKALKENMHYLVLLDDVETLNKKCDQKLLLDFINNNDWSDDNRHYLTKIADLHAIKGIEKTEEEVWDGKTLFEKALADKNIYLLELGKHRDFLHTNNAEKFLSKIEDQELKEKFIAHSRVQFDHNMFDIAESKTEG